MVDDGWVLTLDVASSGRLVAMLTDGRWGCEVAEAPWPPCKRMALPEETIRALTRIDGERLRLQLRTVLDGWPWEHEFPTTAAGASISPRYLTDLPELANHAQHPTPLVVTAAASASHLALVQAARMQQRPLVVADADMPETQRQSLERTLRSRWRDAVLISQALAESLARLGMSRLCCRLYGDGRPPLAASEQGWRPITALSIDLVNSTKLLLSLGAEAYSLHLHAYHGRFREVILRFRGSPEAPKGDGLMAYFGLPLAMEDAAGRALAAAWQLSKGMVELGLQARMGVASGQLAVSAQQPFGSEVHLAARLCAAAQPGQILVARSTYDRVGRGFVLEPSGEGLMLKDFSELKTVYRLCGVAPVMSNSGPRPSGAGNFVGRLRERDVLRQRWSAACAGPAQWCTIRGEAGIGKSRLVQEFSRELRAEGHRCLAITGQAQAASSPFAAVVDALRQHWDVELDLDEKQLRERISDLPLPRCGETDDLDDLVGLLTTSRGNDANVSSDAPRRWSQLLLECLLALTRVGPLCVLVDDAHWLDPSSGELLRRLHDACMEHPLLIVSAERTEPSRSMTLSGPAPVDLEGLTERESHELAFQLDATLPEPLRQQIIDRAEGVPLYLEESLRMRSVHGTESSGEVPATLEDLLMVRLDELGPDRVLAQLVSVLGREFSSVHLDALLEQDDPFVERARQQSSLGSLLASGLLQAMDSPRAGYRFKHALIRDAAYGSIWTPDRKRLHGLCAELIERSTPELWRQRPELLAYHLEAAGRLAQARRAWLAAAQLAAARQAHQETVGLVQRALDLREQMPDDTERARSTMQLQLLLASAQIALHGYGSAHVEVAYQAAERAGNQLTDTTHSVRIRLGLEACYVMRGDLERAAALARVCVRESDWQDDARLALQTRWALANALFHQGDWPAALAGFDDCLSHYHRDLHRRSGVQDPAIMCLGYSSWIHFELGQADEALRRIARMLALAETLQHPFSSGVALGFAASIKRLCGDVEGAWPHALDAVRVCERGSFEVWLAHAWMVRGQLRSDRGEVQQGADDMERGYRLWVGGGARISCATYLTTTAELLLRQGQTQRARTDLESAWRLSEQIGEHYYQAEMLRLQALCSWQSGDRLHAEQNLLNALDLANRQRKPGLALRCALSLGALEASQHRWQLPVQRLGNLLAELPQHGSCRDARWAAHALSCWEAEKAFASAEPTPWEPL